VQFKCVIVSGLIADIYRFQMLQVLTDTRRILQKDSVLVRI